MKKKLYRSRTDRKICGICGGIAEYLGMDSSVVRLVTAILFIAGGLSLWVYIVALFIIQEEPEEY